MHEQGALVVAGLAQLGQDEHALLVLQMAERAGLVAGEQALRRLRQVADQGLGRRTLEAQVDEQGVDGPGRQGRECLRRALRGNHREVGAEKQPGELGVLAAILDDQEASHAASPSVSSCVLCERNSRTTTALA